MKSEADLTCAVDLHKKAAQLPFQSTNVCITACTPKSSNLPLWGVPTSINQAIRGTPQTINKATCSAPYPLYIALGSSPPPLCAQLIKIKIKRVFKAVRKLSGAVEKTAFKVQHVSVWSDRRVHTCCTGLPARFFVKEIPRQLVVSLQLAMDTATPLVNTTCTTPSGHCMLNR